MLSHSHTTMLMIAVACAVIGAIGAVILGLGLRRMEAMPPWGWRIATGRIVGQQWVDVEGVRSPRPEIEYQPPNGPPARFVPQTPLPPPDAQLYRPAWQKRIMPALGDVLLFVSPWAPHQVRLASDALADRGRGTIMVVLGLTLTVVSLVGIVFAVFG